MVLFLCFSVFILNGMVNAQDRSFATFSQSKNVPFTNENIKKFEKRVMDYSSYETKSEKYDNGLIVPNGADPGEGALRTTYTSRWSSGYTYLDDSESSSILSTILNVSLTIAGYFMTTVQNIVIDVASLVFSISWNEVSVSSPGEARLSHSYSYYDHLGQVYTAGSWVTKVDLEAREWYRHEYASFSSGGYTHTGTYDFIPSNGYSYFKAEYKNHFFDDQWILDKTQYIYITSGPNYVDAWTH
ncbi:hypothetical protein [Caloramator mitchellensis]|uniref:hypothetical protein n=1 Tax=Caloramator mitchellensis TaxID=908809 RepID=UPI00128EA0EE|nr:hypothetical protein [Caloramator mitchellensis]